MFTIDCRMLILHIFFQMMALMNEAVGTLMKKVDYIQEQKRLLTSTGDLVFMRMSFLIYSCIRALKYNVSEYNFISIMY